MTTIRLTMAQALLRFLGSQHVAADGEVFPFVAGVMGIFGHGNVTGIGQALEQGEGGLRYIQGHNEQGAVHAATAFAKQKNRLQIFACTSSIGPGALNMVTGAATATVNRIPVLLLPGDTFACRQPDPVLQQIENPMDYTATANDAFKPVSRYWDRVTRPEQLMQALLHAMRVLTDPADAGAVTLCLPQDVQCEAYDYPAALFERRVHRIARRPAATDELADAAALIAGSRRPLIILGGGVHYARAARAAAAFAEAFAIPAAETQAGKSALPWDHPLNMGAVGVTGSSAANRVAAAADLVLSLGSRLADFSTASKTAFQNPNAAFVNVNVNRQDAVKMNALEVTADIREALAGLSAILSGNGYRSGYEEGELARLKAEWDAEVDRVTARTAEQGMAQTEAIGELNRQLAPGDVIVCAAGSLPGDLHRLWRCREPKTYHMEYGFSCMGYEIAGALGVKLADPGREVYALVGDGSYLMLHSELVTSLQEGVKIVAVLFDNHGYQCIRNLQRSCGSAGFGNEFRYRETATGRLTGSYLPIDFAAQARALGARGYSARSAGELRAALDQARADGVSALIHVHVQPGTETDGYESWWRVGVAEVADSPDVRAAHRAAREKARTARGY